MTDCEKCIKFKACRKTNPSIASKKYFSPNDACLALETGDAPIKTMIDFAVKFV